MKHKLKKLKVSGGTSASGSDALKHTQAKAIWSSITDRTPGSALSSARKIVVFLALQAKETLKNTFAVFTVSTKQTPRSSLRTAKSSKVLASSTIPKT